MSIKPLPAASIFSYIVDDFESAWSALVASRDPNIARGNFMFAMLSMILLEFACRICKKDTTNQKLTRLTDAFMKIEPRYFTPLPGRWGCTREFILPGSNPEFHLLGMMFDLVRNGKAHQYQSPIVTLSDGHVDIDLTGPMPDRGLTKPRRRRPAKHLRYKLSASGDLSLYVPTDQLFLDIKRAIANSGIISASDVVADIVRSDRKPGQYNFTVADLVSKLKTGRHATGRW